VDTPKWRQETGRKGERLIKGEEKTEKRSPLHRSQIQNRNGWFNKGCVPLKEQGGQSKGEERGSRGKNKEKISHERQIRK